MKRIILAAVFLMLGIQSFSQEVVKDRSYYLAKSKKQKSTAFGLLIGGSVAIGIGLLVGGGEEATFDEAGTGVIIGGLGFLSMLGSVPLFLASGKNKRKAELMVKTTTLPDHPIAFKNNRQIRVGIQISL